MHQAVARHGFENLVFYQPFEDVVLGKHLSEEWTRIYSDYMHYDPIVRHLRRAVRPFEWREITFDANAIRAPPSWCDCARTSVSGFIVPIPGVSGTRAMVAMSGSRPELTRRNKPALHMMSLWKRCRTCARHAKPHEGLSPPASRKS
jgi:LuxR family transcriptional regulator, quorum-sensing system regulator BjaR1